MLNYLVNYKKKFIDFRIFIGLIGLTLSLMLSAKDKQDDYQPPQFTLSDFKNDFKMMREQKIDTLKPLKWIFYFTGYTQQPLVNAAYKMQEQGFTITGMYSDNSVGFYWLEVEKKEIHTPESLLKQVHEFQDLVIKMKLRSFEKLDLSH